MAADLREKFGLTPEFAAAAYITYYIYRDKIVIIVPLYAFGK